MSRDNTTKRAGLHNHAEAFSLMRYRDKRGHEVTIWNSRDGVTPFILGLHDQEYNHVEFGADRYRPLHTPKPGELVFIDLTQEAALAGATRYVERWWEDKIEGVGKMKDHPSWAGDKEKAVKHFAKTSMETGGGGQPNLVQVAAEGWPKTEEVPRG